MQLHPLGTIVMYQLRHHQPIRKVPPNILFLSRKRNTIDHLINLSQLLLVHI